MADGSPHAFPGAGGTPGGLGEFVIGLVMAAVGVEARLKKLSEMFTQYCPPSVVFQTPPPVEPK